MKTIKLFLILFCFTIENPASVFGRVPDSFLEWKQNGGMFSTEQNQEHCYWNIPDSLLGRDMSLFVSVLHGPEKKRSQYEKQGYAGDRYGVKILRWEREHNDMVLYQIMGYVLPSEVIGGNRKAYDLMAEREYKIALHRLPVCSEMNDCVRIDVTELLQDDALFGLGSFTFQMGLGVAMETRVTEILGQSDALLIRSERVYSPQFPKGKNTRWHLGACLRLLPESPAQVRIASPLMGYFSLPFSNPASAWQEKTPVIKRWRLDVAPNEQNRYLQGETVVPVQPIRFALSPDFPEGLRPVIRESVASWNRVFLKAGFKQAIELYEPDVAMYDDTRFSWIVLKPSPVPNAYGRPFSDPRTGEILSAHVSVFHGVFQLMQQWYITNTGCLRDMNDSETGLLLKLIVEHELGHVLGLTHNFYGSTWLTADELRDKSVADNQTFGSSIMDYMRVNYAAQPADSIAFERRVAGIGPYDTCAINWGYRYFGKSVYEEKLLLDRYLQSLQKERKYRYMNGDLRNPETLEEDLGRNNLATARLGMNYLEMLRKDTTAQGKEWCAVHASVFHDALLAKFQVYMTHALSYLGGYRCEGGDNARRHVSVKPSEQKDALDFICTYYVENSLDIPYDVMNQLVGNVIPVIAGQVYHVADQNRYLSVSYTPSDYLKDVRNMFTRKPVKERSLWLAGLLQAYEIELQSQEKNAVSRNPDLIPLIQKERRLLRDELKKMNP